MPKAALQADCPGTGVAIWLGLMKPEDCKNSSRPYSVQYSGGDCMP